MAEQLTMFELWDTIASSASAAPTSAPLGPPRPVDPRQADLLSGPQTMRAALEDACEMLDADGVRAHHAELNQRFLGQRWADHAPAWAEGIEWLVGAPEHVLGVDEQAARALSLSDDGVASAHLPSLPRHVLAGIRSAALRRACVRLVAERGPAACVERGEPAGWLLLRAGDPEGARRQLAAALAAVEGGGAASGGFPSARAWSWLAEAEWRAGDPEAAVRAYCRACLLGGAVTETEMTCEPILDLLDAAADLELPEPVADWIPVLADLKGLLRIGEEAKDPPTDGGPARQLAAELADYRLRRAAGVSDEAARIKAKRTMVLLAPEGLRELLRKV